MRGRTILCLSLIPVLLTGTTGAQAQSESADTLDGRVKIIVDDAISSGDFEAATRSASELFARVALWADVSQADAFIESAYTRRLLAFLGMAEDVDRKALLVYLRDNPRFAKALVFQATGRDNPTEVFKLVERLRSERGDQLDKFATLAAAICLVYDEPLERRVNENLVKAEDPVKLFDYYSSNEKRMLFGIRDVPTELLVYVVDSTATIPEMKWALSNYAGDQAVGKRFFDINYDYAHFRQGTKKRVTTEGYNLPNILKYGGVCADQAYFAVSVGKAIGVPTTYTRGRSSEVSHAWVGYLHAERQHAAWDFDEGRYEVYQGVRGIVEDPQTREVIPDSYVSVLGEMIGSGTTDRYAAIAMVDAIGLLKELATADTSDGPPAWLGASSLESPRGTDTAARLALLESGLGHNPGCVSGWRELAEMAGGGELTLADKKRWSDVLLKLCGDKYPDFTLAILGPMIQTIDDADEQNRIWESAARLFTKRKDLSAEVLMYQGQMWAQRGDARRAGRCYEAVVDRYVNDGPFVLVAMDQIEQILNDINQPEKILQLYDQTWARVDKPGKMAPEFRVQSNWYKIGKRYAERLDRFGFDDRAAKVQATIKRVTGG